MPSTDVCGTLLVCELACATQAITYVDKARTGVTPGALSYSPPSLSLLSAGRLGVQQLVALQPFFKPALRGFSRAHVQERKAGFCHCPCRAHSSSKSILGDFSQLQTAAMQGPSADGTHASILQRKRKTHGGASCLVTDRWGLYCHSTCGLRIDRSGGASHQCEDII